MQYKLCKKVAMLTLFNISFLSYRKVYYKSKKYRYQAIKQKEQTKDKDYHMK